MQLAALFAIVAVSSSLSGVLAAPKGNGRKQGECIRTQVTILYAFSRTLTHPSLVDCLLKADCHNLLVVRVLLVSLQQYVYNF